MKQSFKILLAAMLCAAVFTQEQICQHLGFGPSTHQREEVDLKEDRQLVTVDDSIKEDYFINDSIYRWDDQTLRWVTVDEDEEFQVLLTNYSSTEEAGPKPIKVEWDVLMDIRYRLKYYKELGMEMYAPVFSKKHKALDGKEVVIEGFVIPFDEEGDLLALSRNPYASCFFCGKASPASVVSMYLKSSRKRYKVDDFKKFRGTLHLNYDDPNEFYYVLRDAKE